MLRNGACVFISRFDWLHLVLFVLIISDLDAILHAGNTLYSLNAFAVLIIQCLLFIVRLQLPIGNFSPFFSLS